MQDPPMSCYSEKISILFGRSITSCQTYLKTLHYLCFIASSRRKPRNLVEKIPHNCNSDLNFLRLRPLKGGHGVKSTPVQVILWSLEYGAQHFVTKTITKIIFLQTKRPDKFFFTRNFFQGSCKGTTYYVKSPA